MKVTKSRSLLKTITFRIVATLTTIIVFYFFTGRLDISLGAGAQEQSIRF